MIAGAAPGSIMAGVMTIHIESRLNARPVFQAGMLDPIPSTPHTMMPAIGMVETRSHQQSALTKAIPRRIACICVSRSMMVELIASTDWNVDGEHMAAPASEAAM